MMRREPEIDLDHGKRTVSSGKFKGQMQMEDIVFRYPARPTVMVMNNLDMTITPGEVGLEGRVSVLQRPACSLWYFCFEVAVVPLSDVTDVCQYNYLPHAR